MARGSENDGDFSFLRLSFPLLCVQKDCCPSVLVLESVLQWSYADLPGTMLVVKVERNLLKAKPLVAI